MLEASANARENENSVVRQTPVILFPRKRYKFSDGEDESRDEGTAFGTHTEPLECTKDNAVYAGRMDGMLSKRNPKAGFPAQCHFSATPVLQCARNTFFRTVLYSVSAATFALVANVSASRSQDESGYIKDFVRLNPRKDHEQFKGKSINVLYSCIVGRSSLNINLCKKIESNLEKINSIKFLRSKNENPYAINFLVTNHKYPYSNVSYYNTYCGKFKSNQTLIVINEEIKNDEINRCLSISTLNHLGFNVRSLVDSAEPDIDIGKLISLYAE